MKLNYLIEYYLFIFFGKLFSSFGYGFLKKSSNFLAYLFYNVLKIRRKVVHKNLSIAFPHLNQNELNQLAYKNYKSSALTFLELFYYNGKNEKLLESVTVDNLDLFYKNISQNKGMIILTAHIGNWEVGAVVAGAKLNSELNVLVKKQKNKYVAEWMTKFREQLNNKEVTLGLSIREIYKQIKDKNVVGIVSDQRASKENGIKVKFFDRLTYTFPGAANIALKTKCPVIVVFCTREENGSFYYDIKEIEHDKFTGTNEEKIVQFNQTYMKILEDTIIEYHDQWFWMHNIWKY